MSDPDVNPHPCGCPYQDPGASLARAAVCGGGYLVFLALLERFLARSCRVAEPCTRAAGAAAAAARYDYVVVGGGAAGPVVARRLADAGHSVLLLEAGGPEPVAARAPSFYRDYWAHAEADWRYRAQPGPYCRAAGTCSWMRGKALGGSAIMNGMMYHRGHAADYAAWEQAAAGAGAGEAGAGEAGAGEAGAGEAGAAWGWEDVRPYFLKSEDNRQLGSVAGEADHARGGLMPVSQFSHQPPLLEDVRAALAAAGLPLVRDMNDPDTPEGFAVAQMFSDGSQRYSAARAFLSPPPAALTVLLHSHVTRVAVEGGRARGVLYLREGELREVAATREVILSAGALNSPHILLLSGIGPQETLQQHGIPLVADLPTGLGLVNHVGVTFYFVLEKMENVQDLDWVAATEYLLYGSGPMASTGLTQLSGVLYSSLARRERQQPDVQLFFNGLYAECSRSGAAGEPAGPCPLGKNISVSAVALQPKSVGFLTLNSSDPLDPPLFHPNYFSHPDDLRVLEDAAEYVRRVVDTKILKEKYGIKLDPMYGACDGAGAAWSARWVRCAARTYTDPQNHQQGSAALGRVLDSRLRVRNVTGLRVMDAAALPALPTGNPQAVVMMLAERGADLLLEDRD